MLFSYAITIDSSWLILIMGGAAFAIALVLGRQLLWGRSPNQQEAEVSFTSFLKGVTQDRRAAPRRKGNTVEVHLSDGSDAEPMRGYVIDRSQGGLCILVDRPLAEGLELKVRPTAATITTPWVEIKVRSCRREGAQYEVGCQFRGTPNWNLLLQFG